LVRNPVNASLHLVVLLRFELLGFLLFHLLFFLGRYRDRNVRLPSTDLEREDLDPLLNRSQLKPIEGIFVLLREIGEGFAPR
jgi:hypothetical protein